jgi:hypothetical protein
MDPEENQKTKTTSEMFVKRLLHRNVEQLCVETSEAPIVAVRLREFIHLRIEPQWKGTATELLKELNSLATDGERRCKSWPAAPNALSGQLTRLAPILRQVGIRIDRRTEGHNRDRLMYIQREGNTSSTTSLSAISYVKTDPTSGDLFNTVERYKEALKQYYEESRTQSPAYQDIIWSAKLAIADAVLELLDVPRDPAAWKTDPKSKKQRECEPGFVYLLRGKHGYFKIGIAKKIDKRIEQIAPQLPFKVQLIHFFPSRDMRPAEQRLHRSFSSKRRNGEWFELSEEDVNLIMNISEM